MEQIRQYLLHLTAVALICSIVLSLFGKKGTFGAVVKFLAGIYLTLSIVSPWVQVKIWELSSFANGFANAAEDVSADGKNAAREAMAQSISQNAAAYILDKAKTLDAVLSVDVILDDSDIPVPCRVCISGNISPYAKKILSSVIAEDLGIPMEEQEWT